MNAAAAEQILRAVSNWGRWGPEDQLGALNLITPEKRRSAATLVRLGDCFSLARTAIALGSETPTGVERTMVETGARDALESSAGDRFCALVHGYAQTHLDALCHVLHFGHMYNGYSCQAIGSGGSRQLGVERMRQGIVTRGVLVDAARLFGKEYLPATSRILPEHLDAWARKTGTRIEPGDALFVRTGRWARERAEGTWDIEAGSAGLHFSAVPWIHQRDVAVLGSDLAADVMPSGVEGIRLPVHLAAISAMGMPIIDNCDLEDLAGWAAEARCWEFLLTVGPWVVDGGTGSLVNPLAIV